MKEEFVKIIKEDVNYQKLLKQRTWFSLKLTLSILVAYFSFILTIAFEPTLLATPLFEGWVTTIGIPIGIFIILFAFTLTGVYTFRANREFDELSQKIAKNLEEKI